MSARALTPLLVLSFLAGIRPAQAAAPGPQSLNMDQAMALLLQSNPQVVEAQLAVRVAESDYRSSIGPILPDLSASLSHTRNSVTAAHIVTNSENSSLGFTATVPLFAGGANLAAVRRKRFELRKTEVLYQLAEAQAVADLREAYGQLLFAQEAILLSDEVVRRREENVQLLKQKYEAGRESKAALLEVEASLAVSKWEREKDEHALRLAQRRLNKVLYRPLSAALRVEPLPPLPKPGADPDWSKDLALHPTLVSDSYDLDIGRTAIDSAKSGFFPTSDLTGSWNKVGSTKWGLQDRNWQWTLGLRFPLFNGGKTTADWHSARTALTKLEVQKAAAKDAVWIEAEDSFLSWKEAAAFLEVADTTLKASESRAWLVKSQYATGQTTYFEWRNVEEQLVSVQKQMLAARRDLILAHARFEKAMGRGAP